MPAPPSLALVLAVTAAPAQAAGPRAEVQPPPAGVAKDSPSLPADVPKDSLTSTGPLAKQVWRRYVALVDKTPADPCPTASAGWTGERLFRRGSVAALLGDKGVLPPALERFCLYTWGGKSPPAAPPAFPGPDGVKVVRVDADREVVVPQAPYLGGDRDVRTRLANVFLQAAGAAPGGAVGPSMHADKEGPARVAVIDTVGFDEAGRIDYAGAAARERHGLAVAEVIAAVRCPNGEAGCRGQQFHAQAFPYVAASPQPQPGGGPLASMASLAHATAEALVRWSRGDMRTSPLILNFSVAWDPRFGDALTAPGQEAAHTDLLATASAGVPATVQAVHTVMVYATCLDVLAIAAAGNNTGAACEQQGLMAPASWERYPAPDRARCEALFGALPPWRPGDPAIAAPKRSLVYGAGGVDAADRPIPVARPGGSSPRVLAALQAVAGAGTRQTDAWTGTSIAAASLSALAAQVWSHHRTLTSHQVLAVLDAGGQLTASPTKERVLRLRAHTAFAHLCTLRYPGVACPNPYAPPTMPAAIAWPPQLISASVGPTQALACSTSTVRCGAGTFARHDCGATAAAASPPPAEPWVRPQPDMPLCPVCPVRGGRLTLSLHPDFTGASVTLQNPVLEFRRADGSYVATRLAQVSVGPAGTEVDLSRYRVSLPTGPVTLAALLAAESIRAGVLAFVVTDASGARASLRSAVTVEP
ncbi:S8 family serine peptidase [Nannocystis pusilla]|uniref:Peptidase S8/S53 domain-containing protein n=1 Tax=Nannocystis pusilla TaxID=889268 RepID=A0ABS7TXH0_9BACT|nr:S8 family serine peptidase [Nannocystis pusilla]MBZ5712896.1 hypothetical protein [Nannocystis pusilla]